MASAARGPGGNRLALGTPGPHRRRGGGAPRPRCRGRHPGVPGMPALRRTPRGDEGRAQPHLRARRAPRPRAGRGPGPATRSARRRWSCSRPAASISAGSSTSTGSISAAATSWCATSWAPTASSGAIAVGDAMAVGTTVQFHLRDAATADEDLHALVAARRADAALVFTCNGRGTRLFGEPHHDVRVLSEHLGAGPDGGLLRRRRARAGGRTELRPRVHGVGGAAP